MKTFTDKFGQFHVKPCENGEPSSNDGLIMTAVADKMGLVINGIGVREMYFTLKKRNGFPIERLPGKETPYPSRDFFLAAEYFGLTTPKDWCFAPVEPPKLNIFKTIASFILAIGEHRNFLWQKELLHAYRFMFSVPLNDRWFRYQENVIGRTPFIYWAIKQFDKRQKGDKASCLVRYLKYGRIDLNQFEEYFFPYLDHPIFKKAKELSK